MKLHELMQLCGLGSHRADPASRCHSIDDLHELARRRTPRAILDYVDGGADAELSLRRNQRAFASAEFTPRALPGIAKPELSAQLLGYIVDMPVVLAPTGYTRMLHPAGERAVARAATRAGIPYTLSTMATTSLEDVALADPGGRRWFQLYVLRDRQQTRELMARARSSDYETLVVSIDTAVPGLRHRDVRNGLQIPPHLTGRALLGIVARPRYWWRAVCSPAPAFSNVVLDPTSPTIGGIGQLFEPALGWDDIEELRCEWPGKLLIKGPLEPEDAKRSVAVGVDGVWLSNHGGRQLDRTRPPILNVAAVRAAIGPDASLIVDSGITNGGDVAVALALGANAAAVGRAYLYGLMADGERGVDRALELMRLELSRTMHLLGARCIPSLSSQGLELVRRPSLGATTIREAPENPRVSLTGHRTL